MRCVHFSRSLFVAALIPLAAHGQDGWSQLKAGMTRSETVAVLGNELQASRARGFEIAIYDARAEVVFLNGQLVAWTAPESSQAASAPTDTWRFEQAPKVRSVGNGGRRPVEFRGSSGTILPAYRL